MPPPRGLEVNQLNLVGAVSNVTDFYKACHLSRVFTLLNVV
jgi:hypothetical protein